MEAKVNREIREYTEAVFFGLTLRQLIFSILACATAVAIFIFARPYIGTEATSWLCILGASPWALLAFFKYNGMNAEQFFVAWFKSEILMPKRLLFKSTNLYAALLQEKRKGRRRKDA